MQFFDIMKFFRIFFLNPFKLLNMEKNELFKETHCRRPCSYMEYKVRIRLYQLKNNLEKIFFCRWRTIQSTQRSPERAWTCRLCSAAAASLQQGRNMPSPSHPWQQMLVESSGFSQDLTSSSSVNSPLFGLTSSTLSVENGIKNKK